MNTPASDIARPEAPVVLVGAGKMGSAMLDGWLARGVDPRAVIVVEPSPAPDLAKDVRLDAGGEAVAASAVVLAVKPQVAAEAVAGLSRFVGPQTLILSIMAGRPLQFLENGFGAVAAVRAMPNTPAAIGRGITVAVANARVGPRQRALADALLRATGAVEWIADEALMDAVTAVSGSGPAYVFLLAEALARAGEAAGLPPELAARLARETVAGSGELLHRSPLTAAVLRQNVTSPGGTTAAALDILMAPDGLERLLTQAVAAATRRSRELAG